MSYDIRLEYPVSKETIELDSPHQMCGGTFAIGGTPYAKLNITYNYGKHYYRVIGEYGIRTIYGKTGAESIQILTDACRKLGDEVSDDYWEDTEGNALRALMQLLALAMMRPDGVWAGD